MPVRRQFQICDSRFAVECRPLGWYVCETWQEIDRHGEKLDEFDLYGPFETREAAAAEKARLEAL